MSKFIKLYETVVDGTDDAQFIKDRMYEIEFEFQNYYIISNHNRARFEINKSLEGIKYDVIIKE